MKFSEYIVKSKENINKLGHIEDEIHIVANVLIECISSGNKVIFCGNGGSAADSQHLAAEFMGRFLRDRKPLPSIALTVDTSAITAIGNDYGYDQIFSRQLRGIAKSGDVLIGISTSGASKNIIEAFKAASDIGVISVALTGSSNSEMSSLSDYSIKAPSGETNYIQEMHIMIGHYLCYCVEDSIL
mgnify:CR=1 FL=1|jgi:D-sedoheptulose 7-phosphate isomerase|tara:strand:+ start:149 stop:706 length:558 start_codon:yes stop_codon:yes gene_type:complete